MRETEKNKIKYYILTLYFTVSSAQVQIQNYDYNDNATSFLSEESDGRRWIWSPETVPGPPPDDNEPDDRWIWSSGTDTEPNNPCVEFHPAKPDFRGPGRRTSEIKCYDYIYELKIRYDKHRREKECYDTNKGLFVGVPGGRDTEAGEFPHMGAVGWLAPTGSWVFKCGSSVISSKFVLTAAHCSRAAPSDTTVADLDPKIVRLGDRNIADLFANEFPPTDAKIIKIIMHPKYASPKRYYDIALMELETDLIFSKYIHPACLWTNSKTDYLEREAILTGWGFVEPFGQTTSSKLQAGVVDIIDTPTCNKLLISRCNRNWCGVHDNQLCAGKLAGGVDACQGDSGGPLQVKIPLPVTTEGGMYYIIGVTSFGMGVHCALPGLPGIYTRVSKYLDWIESIVWPQ